MIDNKMSDKLKLSLRLIIGVSALALLCLWLFVWQQINFERDKELENAARASMNLTKAFEEQVRSIISSADNDMLTIKEAYEKQGSSSPVIAAILDQTRREPAKLQAGVTDEKGKFIVSSHLQALNYDYSDREWFLCPCENKSDGLYISKTVHSKISGKSVIPLSRRLNKPDGSFGGVVHISLDTDFFDTIYKQLDLGSGGVIAINGMDGVNRFRQSDGSKDSGHDMRGGDVWKSVQASPFNASITRGIVDGRERLYTYRVMADYPLFLFVGTATETVLAEFEQRRRNYLLGAVGTSIFIIGICLLWLDRVRKQAAEAVRLRRNTEIQVVLREIAEAASAESSLDELYAKVHQLVGRVLPAKNFYISLVDDRTGRIVRPYCIDETNSVPKERPLGKGLSEYFMRMGRAIHVTSELFARLRETGEVDLYFAPVFECVGAPLRDSQGKVFGSATLVVSEDTARFQPEDVEVLSIIAAQMSMAIERKQAKKELEAANESLERKVEDRTQEIAAANEELIAQNEEMAAMNEEIAALNHNLAEMNEVLERRVAERTEALAAANEELTAQYDALKQAQATLIMSEARLNRAQSIAHVGDWEISLDSGRVWASAEAFNIYGIDHVSEFLSVSAIRQVVQMGDRHRMEQALQALLEKNEKYDIEFKINRADTGAERTVHSIAEIEFGYDGKPLKIVGVIQDITERKQAEEILVESEARYRVVLEQAPEAILLSDLETTEIIEANSRFTELFGYDLRHDRPLTMFDIIDDSQPNIREMLEEADRKGFLPTQRRMLRHKNGNLIEVERSATRVNYRRRKLLVQTLRDISDEVRREREDHYQATHDDLTGLYNRRGFAAAMAEFMVQGTGGALLLVDIDDFKLINDVHGHEVGDNCLEAFATCLRESFGEKAIVARFGGDEFVLFFAGPDGLDAANRAHALMEVSCLETVHCPFFIQVSGGISLIEEQETNLELQVQRAYLALHHAKESGKWCCKKFEPALLDQVNRRYTVKEALNSALTNDEFHLVFQPIFSIQGPRREVAGFEALLRWTSPRLGTVSPAEFIPVAEETNLILPIGKWVLREACLFSVKMKNLFGEFVNISVNISMRQLAMPSFVSMVKEILLETGLPACNLDLEVTESILMTDAATRVAYLQELRDFGVAISLDDFGTGYSSFTYLAQMPITTLKIDKTLVDEIAGEGSNKNLLLMESLLQMSGVLGYKVVAEGVETEEQLQFLQSKGCGYCQGYLLSRPLPEARVLEMYEGGEKAGSNTD